LLVYNKSVFIYGSSLVARRYVLGKFMDLKQNSFLSLVELAETIKEFQSLDFNFSSISDANKLFLKIIKGFHVFPLEWRKGILYRARKHTNTQLFKNTKELIYPINPSKYGRFNNVGQSIFYGAMYRDTAMVELRLNKDDEITLLESTRINLDSTPLFMEVGVKELIVNQNHQPNFTKLNNRRMKKLLNTEEKKIRYEMINNFLIDEITKVVSDNEVYKYKATISIGQYYLCNMQTIGMMYPSISRNGTGCLAIRPESYHQYFTPHKCYKCIVTNIEDNGKIGIYCENESVFFDDEGNINWKL